MWARVNSRYQRVAAGLLFRRPLTLRNNGPYISFTFDDFPRSALHAGGGILRRWNFRGTYYVSLGLMGTEAPTGTICDLHDIQELFQAGHELGCHTYSHCHAWKTSPKAFEDSIIANKRALEGLVPGARFRSLSYPISGPRPFTKRRAGSRFVCCRGGGQTFNVGATDLNHLKAFFLEKSRDDVEAVREMIHRNRQSRGWLIFATHDVANTPTPYGCRPSFFEDVVKYSMDSGARILPVCEALDAIRVDRGDG